MELEYAKSWRDNPNRWTFADEVFESFIKWQKEREQKRKQMIEECEWLASEAEKGR